MIDRYFLGAVVPQNGTMVDQEFDRDQHVVDVQRVTLCNAQVLIWYVGGPTRPCGRSPGWRRLWVAGTRPVPDPDDAACLAALGPHRVADRQMLNRYLAGRDCKMFWI